MTFFYDLNKRLAQLADKQEAQQLAEDAKATAPKSKLAESIEVAERATGDYSAKKAAAGKDLGKPGKNFAKIAKSSGGGEKGQRIAGAVLANLRNKNESTDQDGDVMDYLNDKLKDFDAQQSKTDESAFQAAIGKKKYGDQGMKALQKAGREHAGKEKMANIRAKYDKYDESQGMTDEGNAFTAKLKATPKGEKFKLGDKEFTDTSEIEEGFADMNAWLASREKEKGTGKFDKKERILPGGMKATTYTRKHDDEEDKDDEVKSDAPKKKGRPKGKDKGPERVTAKSYKYKAGRPTKTKEDLDSDGVMMTRPSNMSSEGVDPGEYEQEGDMAKGTVHTIVRNARELEKHLRNDDNLPTWVIEKLGQIKGMMTSVSDYMISQKERGIGEVAPPGAKAERMVKGIKKSLSKDGHLSGKDKAIAYATTWKAKKDGKVEEEGVEKHSTSALKAAAGKDRAADQKSGVPANFPTAQLKAELAKRTKGKVEETGKPDFLDLDKDGDKKEPMKKAAKDKKEEKVDETTVSGSVATATSSGKSSSGGMQFGKGVYEGFNNQVESMITEGMNVTVNMTSGEDGESHKSITVTAEGAEADQLAALLKMAGLQGQSSESCGTCGESSCGCEQTVDEAYGDTDETLNEPDWPTDTETLEAEPNLRTYSGGLNGPKSTGQSTTPVLASQLRRQASMEESVELERNLFKTWKNYKG
jgi:hypothetical protein